MLQRLLARARRHRSPGHPERTRGGARGAVPVLPEALEGRVLMTSVDARVISPTSGTIPEGGEVAFAFDLSGATPVNQYRTFVVGYGFTYVAPPEGQQDSYATPSPSSVADHNRANGGTVNIEVAPNATTGSVTLLVDTAADNRDEADETLEVAATSIDGAPSSGGPASVTIRDWFYAAAPPVVVFRYDECPSTPLGVLEGGEVVNPNATSDEPVRYFDGTPIVGTTDLPSLGFGDTPFGHSRSFDEAAGTTGAHGNGWVTHEQPYLIQDGANTIIAVDSAANRRFYDLSGGTYTPRFFTPETLTTGTNEFLLTDTTGQVFKFHDFSSSIPAYQRGALKSITDPAGNVTTVVGYTTSGRPTEVRRSSGSTIESLLYSYTSGGATNDLLASVTRRRSTDGGSTWVTTRSVEYSYYDGSLTGAHAFGNARDLRTATVKDGAGAAIETKMYRYGTSDTATTRIGAIRYVVNGESYARLAAAVADPLLATDAQVSAYADNYFEYDSSRRVTKEIAQGAGCSSCAGGFGAFNFSYATNPNTPGMGQTWYNFWKVKTTETYADGNEEVNYTNGYGQLMLKVFREIGPAQTPASITNSGTTATVTLNNHGYVNGNEVIVAGATPAQYNGTFTVSNVTANTFTYTMASDPGATAAGTITVKKLKQTRTAHRYDAKGRVELTAHPSAVTGHDEAIGDLLGFSGTAAYLADSTGLIETTEYGGSTTATTSAAGDVLGYVKNRKIKRGETGTSVTQQAFTYIARTAGSITVYPTATETVYRNADGTGAQTTSLAYTYLTGSTRPETVTTTLPTVTTAQNGPNAAVSMTTVFDAYGNATWQKDADGFITALEYDTASGAVTKVIEDVNTTTSTNEPAGWVTPAGGGLHLTTTMAVDALGRTTKLTDPNGNETYTVYRDALFEVRTYPGWTGSATTGPTEVYRQDRARKYTEMLTMSATPATSNGAPTGTEAIANVESLSRTVVNDAGQLIASDRYVSLGGTSYSQSSVTLGTAGTNYHRDEVAYDERGRVERQKNAVGTITWQLYDGLGRRTSTWIGTDDTGADHGDPDGLGAPNNMRKVSENEYDNGTAGDGNLTKLTLIPGGGATNRVSRFYYDWRNRPVATKQGDQGGTGENTDVNRQLQYVEYDNLSQQIAVERYDADGVIVTDVGQFGMPGDGVPDKPTSSLRRARGEMSFDEQGRVFSQKTISIDQSTGATGDALKSDVWYDKRGNPIKSKSPTGLITKNAYDGAARVSKRFFTDGGGDSGWSDADDVTGDKVLEQVAPTYDNNGNVILTTTRQRFHDATDTGELGDPLSILQPKARVTYAAMYYDAANRRTADVNVGTNAVAGVPTAYTRPGTVPARSDSVLVNSYAYDSASRLSTATDPKGIEDRTEYDLLGRTTKTIEAYSDGTPSDADDRITLYTYNGLDQVRTLKADLPTGQNDQTTEYVYGVTPAINSDIYSNDLLAEVRYPDKTTGTASTSNSDKIRYAYSALGQVIKITDRNQSTHEYAIDMLGRTLSDAVTVLGTGVDGAVKRLETAYDTAGRAFKFTSYDAATAGTVANQVQRAFDGLGQLAAEYQEHGGAVNTSTSNKVQYGYDTTASSSVYTKGSRPKNMTYPNGRVLRYEYTTGLDDAVSRISYLADDSSGSVGTHLEEHGYLGLATIVQRKHPEPGVDLSFITSGSTADAGDQYASLDRFGRVTDMKWVKVSGGTHTDRFEYTYDRNSNRLSRDVTATGAPTTLDEAYTYDNLDRLSKMNRGTLSGGTISDANATYTQRWDGAGSSGGLDALGNWKGVGTDADGGGAGSATTQNRTHNSRNQLTAVGGSSLTFDANGNTTTDETGKQLVYDAWNGLVQAKTSGGTNLVTYKLDALKRRIVTTPQGGTARNDYHSTAWQVVEEREGTTVKNQYVWSLAYVDAIVLRDRDAAAGGNLGISGSGLDERLYAQQDANFNVTGLLNASGTVIERFQFLPYGAVTVLDANWATDADGVSDVNSKHGFQGGALETATGLVHFRNRDESVSLGRPVQVDPLGYPDGLNAYEWERSNPIVLLDPSGLLTGIEGLGPIIFPGAPVTPGGLAPGIYMPAGPGVTPGGFIPGGMAGGTIGAGGAAGAEAQAAMMAQARAQQAAVLAAQKAAAASRAAAGARVAASVAAMAPIMAAAAVGVGLGAAIYYSGAGDYIGTTPLGTYLGNSAMDLPTQYAYSMFSQPTNPLAGTADASEFAFLPGSAPPCPSESDPPLSGGKKCCYYAADDGEIYTLGLPEEMVCLTSYQRGQKKFTFQYSVPGPCPSKN